MAAERFDLVVRGTALIDGSFRDVSLGIVGGTIAAISNAAGSRTPLQGARSITLARDEVLIPGLVDSHVHVNDPGRTDWEGFPSATRAAAAGGVTTIIDMPLNSIPPTIDVDALALKRATASGGAIVNTGFWGGAVPENLGTLESLHDAGVFGFKAFLSPSGVDEFKHLDSEELLRALEEIARFGGLLIVHAEDPTVLDAHANHGGTDYARFVDSRPPAAESAAIARVIDGVRRTGARAHILHLSSAASLPMLRDARADGLPITVETCPHYLVFAEESIPNGATQYKCCPPIRDEANQDALWQALVDGDIDLVVTDHSPSVASLKFAGNGDFGAAWGGIAGLQTGLAAVWSEARDRGIPLERVIGWMSTAPARLTGLAGKGELRVSADADFAVFAPDASFTVHADELLYKNHISAFDGRRLHGAVRSTWIAGTQIAGTGAGGSESAGTGDPAVVSTHSPAQLLRRS